MKKLNDLVWQSLLNNCRLQDMVITRDLVVCRVWEALVVRRLVAALLARLALTALLQKYLSIGGRIGEASATRSGNY